MKTIGVFYATREGHTARIAEFIARRLGALGVMADVQNLAGSTDVDPRQYAAVVLAASVHMGKHEREIVKFVEDHRDALNAIPAAFLSVTLSEAGVERPNATAEKRRRSAADVQRVLQTFFDETGWHPKWVKAVAGALSYSKYNIFVRFVMKRIARKAGGDTDTSRDWVYTDWEAIEHFIDEFYAEARTPAYAHG